MPEDGHCDRNVQQILTRRIKFVMVEGSTYDNFNMIYHNGTNFTKVISLGFYIWLSLTGERRHLKI